MTLPAEPVREPEDPTARPPIDPEPPLTVVESEGAPAPEESEPEPASVVIDSHHHLWDPAERDYPWMPDVDVLQRRYGVGELLANLDLTAVEGTVLVQTVGDTAETEEFLALAAATEQIRGVVGWVDLTAEDVGDAILALRAAPGGDGLVGLRHQVTDEPDAAWLARDDVKRGLAAVADSRLTYDLLLFPQHLPLAHDVCRELADGNGLRCVLDHLGNPDIAGGGLDVWAAALRPYAELESVACKLSGILTRAGDDASVTALTPYVQVALDVFGPRRLMFGSDWPVSLQASDYPGTYAVLEGTLEALGVGLDDQAQVLGGTATRWYGL